MARGPALTSTLALAGALAWCPASAGPPEVDATGQPQPGQAVTNAQPSEAERKAAAKAEVRAAGAAFSAGDYATAIERYEAAMAILPAPKLHYNIGVCHQRLALAAGTPEQRTRRRDLAIESYNRYLEQNPRAEDRLEVAETIRELGGMPVTMPALKPLFEGDEGEAQAGRPEVQPEPQPAEPQPQPEQPPPEHPRKAYPHHGRLGILLAGGFSPTMRAARAIDARGLFALDLHAGGFLGNQRRFLLAAHTSLYSGVALRADGFSFYGYSLGLLGQQTWVLGREGVQLGFGGVVALTGQGLNQREEVAPPLCALDRGAQIAARAGGLVAPRFDLGILLGARRRGMIGVLVQPSFAMFGDGPIGEQCSPDETPWTALGVRSRWQFQLWLGAGFGFRF